MSTNILEEKIQQLETRVAKLENMSSPASKSIEAREFGKIKFDEKIYTAEQVDSLLQAQYDQFRELIERIVSGRITKDDMEDILTYTTIPVLVTDNGPAPKRPSHKKEEVLS